MRFLTAGESHGLELTAIIDGLPAGLPLTAEEINQELKRRQGGYGRGERMLIETDTVQFTSGIRHGETLGSPVTMIVKNDDAKNWQSVMSAEPVPEKQKKIRRVAKPRPGHADLVGLIKYGHKDVRNVLERSSARETTMRVAIGAVCKKLLQELGITVASHVVEIAGIRSNIDCTKWTAEKIKEIATNSSVFCLDNVASGAMEEAIDQAKLDGTSIGGVVEVVVDNVPLGLGSYVQWDQKLDGKLAQAILSINAFKGVEFGVGFDAAHLNGSQVMDEINWDEANGYSRNSNRLGGFEGGMTNGMPIVVRGVMKPIPTQYKPLQSINIDTKTPYKASIERSDSCAVPAASVVAEHVVATEIAKALLDKFEADSFSRLQEQVQEYRDYSQNY